MSAGAGRELPCGGKTTMLTVSVLFGEFSQHREPSLISIDD
jgi:hypothetical protein